eukprot:CAMPEP_0113960018 /NCGR_PEP_ID=MMETSP0011_2-20120614/4476_1 /TAXON_ID=101924 /ORGANISM="Rhodosorus marinus" /LENGTH=278 /DNA_ID=CAMNT_0000971413 /DNA_START=96 /DNA_END=932 /DNA_ORIENTATION=- /assembly_acc=CAM_ASM_000156
MAELIRRKLGPEICYISVGSSARARRTRTLRLCNHAKELDAGVQKHAPVLELIDCWLKEPGTRWGYYLFEEINFRVERNEAVVVVGENGTGKTTLMDLLAGYNTPSKGKLLLNGKRSNSKNLGKAVGSVFQFPGNYFLGSTILDELIVGRDYATPDLVREVMKQVGLYDVSLLQNPRQLSGGQKRRLSLASQLMRQPIPEVLIMDEPLAGIDRRGHLGIVELIESLKNQMAVVIVTHDPGVLLTCADRMVQLSHKKLWPVPQSVVDRGLEVRHQRGEF